jgi:hypothetical protein
VPVWLHLLKRHRTTPLPFSSLMFFEPRTQSSIKHRRLRYLLLFALRTLLLIALALAFANPFIPRSAVPAASSRKLVVVAIDQSFSMRQGDRLDRAKRDAEALVAGLRGEDTAQVLAFSSGVRMMSDATSDTAALRAGIRAITAADSRGSFAELARALRSIAQTARIPVEAHLFSDMQKSSLPSNFADLRLAAGVKLVPHPVSDRRVANFALENVIVPRYVYDPRKVRVQVTVAGYGTERATRRVALVLDGKELDSRTVEVPAGGRASVEFLSLDAAYGLNRGEVRIDSADSFAADDRFFFSVERADPRPALFVHESRNARGLLYFRTALAASGQSAFTLTAATPEQAANLAPERYAFVVLSDVAGLPPAFDEALKKWVRGGGSLLVALGRDGAQRKRVPVFDEAVLETRYFAREGDRFQSAAWLDPTHPAIRRANRWDDVKFYQAVKIEPGQARVAARLSDETPLLLEKRLGEGRVLVFASTFDNISNDFPLHAAFVPFVDQAAQYLGGMDDRSASFAVDSYLELRRGDQQGGAVEVLDPRGERALSLEESRRARNIQLSSAGFYDVRRTSERHELIAVNADRQESDLEIIPGETLALWQRTAEAAGPSGEEAEAARKPFELWWYLMIAVLVVAIAESLIGNRHLSVEKEAA